MIWIVSRAGFVIAIILASDRDEAAMLAGAEFGPGCSLRHRLPS